MSREGTKGIASRTVPPPIVMRGSAQTGHVQVGHQLKRNSSKSQRLWAKIDLFMRKCLSYQ
jgi:hypothetical protein